MSTVQPNPDESQLESGADFGPPIGGLIVYRKSQQADSFCTARNRPLLRAVNTDTRQVVFFRPRCGTWTCPSCAKKNAARAVLRAVNGVEVLTQAGCDFDFVTVTSHEKLGPVASLAVLPKAWNKLNTRIKRAVDAQRTPQYFAIPEQHSDGRWHMHAIVSFHLPRRWWKDNARACGLGYQSDAQEVKSIGGVAAYVAKYQVKMLQNSNLPKHLRRIRHSHGWPALPTLPSPTGWNFSKVEEKLSLQDAVTSFQKRGYATVLADEDSSWDWIEHFTGL